MGCNPECYTKGRGCVVSKQGRCALLFDENEKEQVRSFRDTYEAMVKENRMKSNTHKYISKKNRKISP